MKIAKKNKGEFIMIRIYTGVPGSGKSYHMAELICIKYRQGKNIFCNFEVDVDYLKKKYPRSKAHVFILDNRELLYPFGFTGFSNNFHKIDKNGRVKESQSYLFIDECNKNFDSRRWNQRGREEWNDWLSEHRKDGFEVILCTQSIEDVDKKIRGRIETEVKHFSVKNFKMFGRILSLFSGGNLFLQRTQWVTKSKTKANKISSTFTRGKRKYYKVFNTSKRFMRCSDSNPVWRAVGN